MPILEPFIETYKGRNFYFLNPNLDDILIEDIAHSLAYCCRFTGHSRRFYSVAEHSVLVSYLAADPLSGLLHDASESYITDIASPIKPHLGNYKEMEDKIMQRIAAKFGFQYPLDPDIKDCDSTQLKTEAKHLLRSGGHPWAHMYPTKRPHGITPNCWSPEVAEKKFLERFEEVRNSYVSDVNSLTGAGAWDEIDNWLGRRGRSLYLDGVQSPQLDGGQLREKDSGRQDHHCGEDAKGQGTRSGSTK